MLAVKTVHDRFLGVDAIEDPVSVVFLRCCEDYQLKMRREVSEERVSVGTDKELWPRNVAFEVDKSFIEVENQGVFSTAAAGKTFRRNRWLRAGFSC